MRTQTSLYTLRVASGSSGVTQREIANPPVSA